MKCKDCNMQTDHFDGGCSCTDVGVKYDTGKLRFGLLPPAVHEGLVKVLTYGANKYSADNWKLVDAWRYVDAMGRHINAWQKGDSHDAESGLHHLYHAMACITFIIEHEKISKEKGGKDGNE